MRNMKIYISSSLEDIPIVKKICKSLEKQGHIITFKWWNHNPITKKERKDHCDTTEDAIRNCQVFVFYNGERKTSGKYVELGMAILLKKHIIGMGKPVTSIFREKMDDTLYDSDDKVENYIEKILLVGEN